MQTLAMASERMKASQLNHREWTAIVYLNVPPDEAETPPAAGAADGDDAAAAGAGAAAGAAGAGAGGSSWDPLQDGGSLRCWVGATLADDTGETAEEVLDLAPIGGRSVVFPSRELLHAVTPTHRRRLAMTAWIFDEGILQSEEMAEFVG